MLIQYVDPSPKSGQREHKQPVIAETLIAAGFAIRVLEPDSPSQAGSAGSVAPPFAEKPSWSVGTEPGGRPAIMRLNASETIWFVGPPHASYNCPKEILERFKKMTDPKKAEAIAEANAKSRAEAEAGIFGTRIR